jgi:hypothetical protein
MSDDAVFRSPSAGVFEPTAAAVGPWDPRIVHGAAIAGLFGGQLTPTEGTLARITIEILAPVPLAPLVLERSEPAGGSRVQRRQATLSCDGRTVATATAVVMRSNELDLPAAALDHDSPFDPAAVPPLTEPHRRAAETVGHESFDSLCLIRKSLRVEGDERVHHWLRLALPIVEGTELSGVELAVVTADYAQSAVFRHLPLTEWSFRNTELTVHLVRPPSAAWIGARCEAVVDPCGAGFNAADLYDERGRLGRAASAIVVEPRRR